MRHTDPADEPDPRKRLEATMRRVYGFKQHPVRSFRRRYISDKTFNWIVTALVLAVLLLLWSVPGRVPPMHGM